ncbi:hypothetical protein BGX29_009380 [Mortierella sp. GBA35]|nr:hypothetical protein BGX29_009380 [Mortierella sp. GBA35]
MKLTFFALVAVVVASYSNVHVLPVLSKRADTDPVAGTQTPATAPSAPASMDPSVPAAAAPVLTDPKALRDCLSQVINTKQPFTDACKAIVAIDAGFLDFTGPDVLTPTVTSDGLDITTLGLSGLPDKGADIATFSTVSAPTTVACDVTLTTFRTTTLKVIPDKQTEVSAFLSPLLKLSTYTFKLKGTIDLETSLVNTSNVPLVTAGILDRRDLERVRTFPVHPL